MFKVMDIQPSSLDIFCGNKNLPSEKMFGGSKVVAGKTEF